MKGKAGCVNAAETIGEVESEKTRNRPQTVRSCIKFCADVSMPNQESEGMFISRNWAHYTYEQDAPNHGVKIVGQYDLMPVSDTVRTPILRQKTSL